MGDLVRSSNGVMVDMETIRLKNEKVVAVGNMGVNARGDVVVATPKEKPQTRQQRMAEHYKLHSMIPQKTPVKSSSAELAPARKARVLDTQPVEMPAAPRGSLASAFAEDEVPAQATEQTEQPKEE